MASSPLDPHDPVPPPGPDPVVVALKGVLRPFASLRLTVVLLALAVVLVFFGTLAQKTAGIWTTVDKYFWSWVVMIDLRPTYEFSKIFFGFPKDPASAPSWAAFPFPGGKLLGALMFVNLLAAHALRFQLTWKRAGIWLTHGGLLLLFVGEFVTREFQVEQRMTIPQHQSVNFSEDSRRVELSFATPDTEGTDRVTVVPGKMLEEAARTGDRISHPDLPVDVEVNRYMVNSGLLTSRQLAARKADGTAPENPATAGLGTTAVVEPRPEVSGVGEQTLDLPSAYVTLYKKGTDEKIGTYLVSLWFTYNSFDRESQPTQSFESDGVSHDIALRFTRYYKPFSLYLKEFRFDRYTGTQQAKNYSSDVILIDPERGQERAVRISMNDPLFYRGETFYQQTFDSATEATTVLQVVRNPGWFLPYASCIMVGVGLLFHFVLGLVQYLQRQRVGAAAAGPGESVTLFERLLPWGVVALGGLMLLGAAMPRSNPGPMDLKGAGRLPVVDGGRLKPLDTVARVYLRKISAREQYANADGKMRPAIEWLLDALSTTYRPVAPDQMEFRGPAAKHRVIRIENDQVLALLNLTRREGYRYSLEEIGPKYGDMLRAYEKAFPQDGTATTPPNPRIDQLFESGDRDVFRGQLKETYERVSHYLSLCDQSVPLALPPSPGLDWRSIRGVYREAEFGALFDALDSRGLLPPMVRSLPKERRMKLPRESIQMVISAAANKLTDEEWTKLQEEVENETIARVSADPAAQKWATLVRDYKDGDALKFATALSAYRQLSDAGVPEGTRAKVRFEVFLNEFAPTYQVIYLYVLAAVLALAGWVAVGIRPTLASAFQKSAFWLLVLTFAVHGFALFARMYLMDRPLVFVTNLYSTAVFIGWAAVGLGLVMERIVPIGLGNLSAAVVGGLTAIIAHNLATSGDTLEMMQAVLDTNFWLATHVTTINLGYAATYVAGVIGIIYILVGVFTPALGKAGSAIVPAGPGAAFTTTGPKLGRLLGQLMYGVVCLATLLSFVGTVLGGIWADYSWGRFWGWDPKENGAVLIVLWNALILHARWCGLVKDRGMAVLTLGGNIITTWSYFGTNQLGVGLHAYGFNTALATGCAITWLTHLALIGLGMTPLRYWRSFSNRSPQPLAAAATPAGEAVAGPRPAVNGHHSANGSHAHGEGKGKKPGKRR
ncbi:MAG TPA: cytochrome c biogenesis protein CcsA [Gemmata sp.]|nr:cytochrome c biogenesis protein CcsA [Gemmata sp.]